jgi:hypothetical protein
MEVVILENKSKKRMKYLDLIIWTLWLIGIIIGIRAIYLII